ncbi:hypothetical protein U1Q18_016766 [Sarracenia purpurea var. burkii]
MEEDRELRFVCKLCNKRYPSGKSLGGHMRSHVIANSAEFDEKVDPRIELGGQSGYGLRENPKKTWRVSVVGSNPNSPLQQEQVCKQCGKGFHSLKALCGHMACHSEKERILKDDHSWTSENQKMVVDEQSDTEAASEAAEAPRRRQQPPRRAASVKCKRIVVGSSSLANGSSSVSEIDHEQEEVAMCLMMLSRDSGNWVGVNSIAESSDNNSVVLETKSSSIDMRIGRKKGSSCVFNGGEALEIKKPGKGKSKSSVQFESNDSGYFVNGAKKLDSVTSVDGFLRNDNFKKQKVDFGSRIKASDAELGKGLNRVKCRRTDQLINGFPKDKQGFNRSGIASNSTKYDSKKRSLKGSYDPDSCGEPCKKQALSCKGERRSKLKKSKGHECPICHKVYKSGQALGGHKRSHFLGGSEQKTNQTAVIEQELSEVPDLLDLNLPAPAEEEANEHPQFMQW